MAAAITQQTTWPVVQTDAGPVTLAQVGDLQSRASQWRDWATSTITTAQSLRSQAEDRFAIAGAILVGRLTEWEVPANLQAPVKQAAALTNKITSNDQTTASLKERESSAGLIGRIGVSHQEHVVERERSQSAAQLRSLLIRIASSAPTATISKADEQRKAATDLESQANVLDVQIQTAEAWAAACDDEVRRRQEAIKAMGFDSLYEVAALQTSGPSSVECPLVLKKGEQAYLSIPATLARVVTRTHYVGGSSGFSFPILHTGIRYRVGSFRGEPIHQEALTKLDAGTFVVTNQRVAYVGRTKVTSVALAKVMHVEVYNDGLSIAREGKENPDFYLMSNPKHAIFLVNWFLAKQSSAS
jgi:hypothetical protein